jgi:apolipoprotein D and lipocalin family protein
MAIRIFLKAAIVLLSLFSVVGAKPPPLPVLAQPVDLREYAGQWYVHGAIPLQIPFFSDADARNYTETYEWLSADTIRMTSAFDAGEEPDSPRRSFSFSGKVVDSILRATWKIRLVWPVSAEYSIIYLDDAYATTIVASANRNYAWIMSREPFMSESKYMKLIDFLQDSGFDPQRFRKVPHDPVDSDAVMQSRLSGRATESDS